MKDVIWFETLEQYCYKCFNKEYKRHSINNYKTICYYIKFDRRSKKKTSEQTFEIAQIFQVPAVLIDWVLSFHNLLDSSYHQIEVAQLDFFPFTHVISCLFLKNWLRLLKLIPVLFFSL